MTFIVRLYIAGVADTLRVIGAKEMSKKCNSFQKGLR